MFEREKQTEEYFDKAFMYEGRVAIQYFWVGGVNSWVEREWDHKLYYAPSSAEVAGEKREQFSVKKKNPSGTGHLRHTKRCSLISINKKS